MTSHEKVLTTTSLLVTAVSIAISFPINVFSTLHFQSHIADLSTAFRFLILALVEISIGHGFAVLIARSNEARQKGHITTRAFVVFFVILNAWVTLFNVEFFISSHCTGYLLGKLLTKAFASRVILGAICGFYGLFILTEAMAGQDDERGVVLAQLWAYVIVFFVFSFS